MALAFVIFILQLPPNLPSLPPAGPARPSRLPLVRSRSRSRRPPVSAARRLSVFESGFEIGSFQAASRLDWIEGRASQIPACAAAACCRAVPSSLLASLNPLHTTSSHTLSPLSPPARPPARPPRRSVLTSLANPASFRTASSSSAGNVTPRHRNGALLSFVPSPQRQRALPSSPLLSPPSFSLFRSSISISVPFRARLSPPARSLPPCNLQPWRGRWTRRT